MILCNGRKVSANIKAYWNNYAKEAKKNKNYPIQIVETGDKTKMITDLKKIPTVVK